MPRMKRNRPADRAEAMDVDSGSDEEMSNLTQAGSSRSPSLKAPRFESKDWQSFATRLDSYFEALEIDNEKIRYQMMLNGIAKDQFDQLTGLLAEAQQAPDRYTRAMELIGSHYAATPDEYHERLIQAQRNLSEPDRQNIQRLFLMG
ncbi:hypothetical protein Ciccas_011013 [Cichlidogyrus casuarinus]|uniref:Uncharacterized protein n=1 Tax=Cichlidogyrus casuarinus TaxID=1844966 RepID=A0ABD2PTL6_9PLAT